jgi:hypothetical protein
VGTREQLSTLYRLSLAEYLGSTIVLDDQLVQYDENRMDWFRALLVEKARNFQTLVSRVGRAITYSRALWFRRATLPAQIRMEGSCGL